MVEAVVEIAAARLCNVIHSSLLVILHLGGGLVPHPRGRCWARSPLCLHVGPIAFEKAHVRVCVLARAHVFASRFQPLVRLKDVFREQRRPRGGWRPRGRPRTHRVSCSPCSSRKGEIFPTRSWLDDLHFSLLLARPNEVTRKCKHTSTSPTVRIN